ncbi:MAG: SRPBCC family protein [Acidimicrobiales bacterium]
MSQTTSSRMIHAPVEAVFDCVAHIQNFSHAVPDISKIEFLTQSRRGVGTRFRETRVMKGREATTELEVTEYDAPHRVRFVSDEGGTIWDTVFTTVAEDGGTRLEMVMDARAYKLTAKIVNPFIGRMISKAIEDDMDAVKTYCETAAE